MTTMEAPVESEQSTEDTQAMHAVCAYCYPADIVFPVKALCGYVLDGPTGSPDVKCVVCADLSSGPWAVNHLLTEHRKYR